MEYSFVSQVYQRNKNILGKSLVCWFLYYIISSSCQIVVLLTWPIVLLLGWRSFISYLANHNAATWLAQLLNWPIIVLLLGWRSFLAYLANHHAAAWLAQL